MQTSDKGLDVLKLQAEYDKLVLEQALLPEQQALELQNSEQSIKDKELSLKEAEVKLKDLQADFDALYGSGQAGNSDLSISTSILERNNDFESLVREYRSGAESLKELLNSYDDFMNETDDFYDPAEYNQHYIGAKNVTLLLQSKNQFYELKKDQQALEELYAHYQAIPIENLSKEMILSGHQIFRTL